MALETTKKSFLKFLEFCRTVTDDDDEVLKLLHKRYNKTNQAYLNSEAFIKLMHGTTEQIKNDLSRKFVYIKEFISELRAYGSSNAESVKSNNEPPAKRARLSAPDDPNKACTSKSLHFNSVLHKATSEPNAVECVDSDCSEKSGKCKSENHDTRTICNSQVFLQALGLSPRVVLTKCQSSVSSCPPPPSQTSVLQDVSGLSGGKHRVNSEASHLLQAAATDLDLETSTKKTSEKHIERLESLLGELRNEIQRLEEVDLGLDDLEKEDSNYILLDKYKTKFVKVWNKLCELKCRNPTTGRPIERRFRFEGTRYPVINRKVEKFINKHQIFPDYPDIFSIICYCNKKHNLRLRKKMLQELAKDVFTEVGNRLQERRMEDFISNFGSHLTDRYKTQDDPAFYDKQLRKKLEGNQIESRSRLDEVINKFAAKQFAGDEEEDGNSSPDHPLDVGAIDSDPNEVLEAGGDDEDDEDDQEEVGINEEADNGENCKLSTSFSRKKHSFNSIFMPQGSTPEAVTCFKDDAVIDLNSLNQVMDPLSEGSSEMEDDAKTDDSRSDAPSLHLHPKEQQPSKSVENLISGTSGSRNITITLNPTTETKDGVMDIKSSMDDAQLSASGNYNGASDTDLEESSLRKGNSQSSCSLKISDICSLSVVQNDLAAIDQPVAGEEASVDVDCSTLNKTEGNHGAHNQSSSMDQQLIQTDVIMPPNSHNSGDGEELNEESEKFSNENKSLILTSLHTDHSDMLTRATGESPILFDSNPGQLDYVSVTGEDNASKPSDMGSVNSLKKESACLSRGSPAGHSSDKENAVSPLGECNVLEKNNSDLSSPSLDGNDQKRCDIVKDTDDWGKSVTGRLSDGKKPLENKRLKLLDKVKLNRSDEGIKKVSSALRASLNKLGHQIASTPTPVMEIEVLSGSSDDENAEEVRALMKTKETTAGGNTQTCSTDNMRDSRSGKNCGVKALDSSLSVTFTAQIHSEYNNEAEKKTLSSPRRNDEVGDHEVKDGVTVEDQSNSPAGNSSHQKLPNAFTCEVEKVLPLPEQSEQKTDNNPTLIATITESTPVENCDDVVQTSAMPIPSHSNQKAAVQSSEQTNNYCRSNSALDDDEPAQVETVGNKPDTNGCRTSAYDGVDTKRPDVKDVLTSDKIDADGKSSENKNILICDDGSDSDDCVLITQVDMKRKRVLVKTEPTKPASLLSKLDLNSICSSVVSKVLEENHPSMPVNKLAQPPINITPGYRPVIPPVSLAGGKQPVTRLFPTTLRKLQPKPHSSFMPSDTSTPIKHRMAIPPGTANYRWRGATNGGNIPTVVTWTKYGPRLPSYGSQLARGLGRNGNPVLLPQEQSKANQAIVIKPSSTRGPVHNHPVASRKRHRNGVQSNDVIVLSDSD